MRSLRPREISLLLFAARIWDRLWIICSQIVSVLRPLSVSQLYWTLASIQRFEGSYRTWMMQRHIQPRFGLKQGCICHEIKVTTSSQTNRDAPRTGPDSPENCHGMWFQYHWCIGIHVYRCHLPIPWPRLRVTPMRRRPCPTQTIMHHDGGTRKEEPHLTGT